MIRQNERRCHFCDRPESEVSVLFTGLKGAICDLCIENAHGLLQEALGKQAADEAPEQAQKGNAFDLTRHRVYKPREIS